MRSVYLKIAICIEVFLLAFTFCVFPAKADTYVSVLLRQSFIGGTISCNGNVINVDASDIKYVLNVSRTMPDGSVHQFSGYTIDRNRFTNYSGNVADAEVEFKFALFPDSSILSHTVSEVQFICCLSIDGYKPTYNYGIDDIYLDGVSPGRVISPWGDYLGYRAGGEFYNFYYYEVQDQSPLTGYDFKEITVKFRWTGNPNSGEIDILFDDSNFISLSDYSADIGGVLDGLSDVKNEIGKTNDLIEQPLGSDEEQLLDDQSATNSSVRQEAESMADALDQFQAPTDDIQGVNNSISDAIDEHPEEVDLLTLDFSDSSEFFNTVTIVGVPGLGICFLGYVLYGKKG